MTHPDTPDDEPVILNFEQHAHALRADLHDRTEETREDLRETLHLYRVDAHDSL